MMDVVLPLTDLLHRCTSTWGEDTIFERDPALHTFANCVFLPYRHSERWGLYHEDGVIVRATLDFREGIHAPPDQKLDNGPLYAEVTVDAPDSNYIYGGRINTHFGHFLIDTLPRFWDIARSGTQGVRILCHGVGSPHDWFSVPFIAAVFGALDLSESDFVAFDGPTRMRSISVPYRSLEGQRCGYRVMREMCVKAAAPILASKTFEPSDIPIYYSKSRLSGAVGNITNEIEIDKAMRAAGIDIVHPELLSFEDQLGLMASRSNILGTAGSFLHASIFCPPRRMTCLSLIPNVTSNYTIIDQLADNDARYFYPPGIMMVEPTPGFYMPRYLPDATGVARSLIEAMRR